MKSQHILCLLILTMSSSSVWAYGSSSSSKACSKPKFSEFTPVNHAEVAPQAEFSFLASPNTRPESISVTVKGETIKVNVIEKNQSLLVSGRLPPDLKDTSARININAEAGNACKGSDGWLVQIMN